MKLYLYELYKIFCKRTVWLLVAGLFLANGIIFYAQSTTESKWYISKRSQREAVEAEYMDSDYKATLEELSAELEELNALDGMERYVEYAKEDEFWEEVLEELLKEYPDLHEKYAESPYLDDRALRLERINAIMAVKPQLEHIAGYRDYILGMQERADQMMTVSIFQKKGSFSYNNILRTPKDFLPLADLELKLGDEYGITEATGYRLTDIFIPGMLFLFCIYLFLHEKETGLDKLVRSARKGRTATILARLAALDTLAVLLSAAFYATILILGKVLFGYGDLGRYVQSMPSFRDCALSLSVGQYLTLYFLCKIAAAVLTAGLMALIFTAFGEGKSVFIILGAFAAVEALCYLLIHPASWANLAKYVNIFSAWDTGKYLSTYTNINFFAQPVNRLLFGGIFGAVAFLAAEYVACVVWTLHISIGFAERFMEMLGRKISKRLASRPLRGSVSLTAHEGRKLLLTGRAWLILALALLLAWNAWDTEPLMLGTMEDAAYKVYANRWSGELTEEKIREIEEENDYIQSLSEQMDALTIDLRNGKLTQSEYAPQYDKLYSYQKNHEEGFQRFYRQYSETLSLPDGIRPAIVDSISAEFIFDNESDDLFRGLLGILLVIVALARVFPLDEERGLLPILAATKYGRRRMRLSKLAVSLGTVTLIWAAMYVPKLVTLFQKYNLSLSSAAQNAEMFRGLPFNLSVGGLLGICTGVELLAFFTAGVWTLNLTRTLKKLSVGIIVSAVILTFPFLGVLIGVEFLRWCGLTAAVTPYYMLADAPVGIAAAWGFAGYCAVLVGVFAVGIWMLLRERKQR